MVGLHDKEIFLQPSFSPNSLIDIYFSNACDNNYDLIYSAKTYFMGVANPYFERSLFVIFWKKLRGVSTTTSSKGNHKYLERYVTYDRGQNDDPQDGRGGHHDGQFHLVALGIGYGGIGLEWADSEIVAGLCRVLPRKIGRVVGPRH